MEPTAEQRQDFIKKMQRRELGIISENRLDEILDVMSEVLSEPEKKKWKKWELCKVSGMSEGSGCGYKIYAGSITIAYGLSEEGAKQIVDTHNLTPEILKKLRVLYSLPGIATFKDEVNTLIKKLEELGVT